MKKIFLFFVLNFLSFAIFSQEKTLPSVEVKNLKGASVNTKNLVKDGKPIIISFWATWCKPCIEELTAISEEYSAWQQETGVILYAVSVDDSKSNGRIKPLVNNKDWEYEILLDANGDFKREMNVVDIPHIFIVDGNNKIVWQHTGYIRGDETEVIEQIRKLIKK